MFSIHCPRCGDAAYEQFRTYTYCHQCNHSSEYEIRDEELETLKLAAKFLRVKTRKFPSKGSLCVQIQPIAERRSGSWSSSHTG